MELLTTRNVAESLGFSSRYVCTLAAAQKIKPFATLANKQLVFTKEEVENRASEIAASYGVDKAELLKAYGSMDVIEYDMKMHKALEILKENN